MSSNAPERPPTANFLAALDVRRNAVRGFGFGVLFTALVLVLFVLVPGTARSPLPYLGLGFVLAASLGALATGVLTFVSAYRLARELD